jgi:predicted AAA+ superfamily ATPase
MEKNEINRLNHHWANGWSETEEYTIKRKAFKKLENWLQEREIIAIHGLRRTGKSVLLEQLANKLIKEEKVKARNILFFSFDSDDIFDLYPASELQELLNYFFDNIVQTPIKKISKKTLIILDELQNVSGWSKILKTVYDLNSNIKFLISGSASLFLEDKAESLVGRIKEELLEPLDFSEFCEFLEVQASNTINSYKDFSRPANLIGRDATKEIFEKFMLCGGFPETANKLKRGFSIADLQDYIKNSIVKKIVTRDLKKYYRVTNTLKDWELIKILTFETSRAINLEKLAKDVGYSPLIVNQHLDLLERSYLIKSLKKFDTSRRKILSAHPKYYISSPCIILSLLGEENCGNSNLIGRVAETYVERQLRAMSKELYYAASNTNQEIDFYAPKEKYALEVKYGNYEAGQLDFLKQIAVKYKLTPVVLDSLNTNRQSASDDLCRRAIWEL